MPRCTVCPQPASREVMAVSSYWGCRLKPLHSSPTRSMAQGPPPHQGLQQRHSPASSCFLFPRPPTSRVIQNFVRPGRITAPGPQDTSQSQWVRLASHSLWCAGRGLPLHPPLHPQEHEPLPASVIEAASPSVILAEVSRPLGVDVHAPDFLMWADPR